MRLPQWRAGQAQGCALALGAATWPVAPFLLRTLRLLSDTKHLMHKGADTHATYMRARHTHTVVRTACQHTATRGRRGTALRHRRAHTVPLSPARSLHRSLLHGAERALDRAAVDVAVASVLEETDRPMKDGPTARWARRGSSGARPPFSSVS